MGHIANNGIGWNDDYRCPNCIKNIAGVIQKMMTKKGRRLRRRENSGVTQGKVIATKARKVNKRKVVEKETEGESVGDTNKNKKQKHPGKSYTEEEVNELKKLWVEENKEKIDDMGDEDKNNECNILENSIFRINKICLDCE